MQTWRSALAGDPLPWLLEPETPAVRHLTLRRLCDGPADSPEVREALSAAMLTGPIAETLAAQHPDGYWVKPGPGYSPKYRSTVWSLMFLDQAGADGTDERIRKGCEYLIEHAQASGGGLSYNGSNGGAVHCLSGNALATLIHFGWLDDERVRRAIDWQTASITGEGAITWFKSGTPGPGFRCRMNEDLPCAWGAVKATRALAAIPADRRSRAVDRAIEVGLDYLLSVDPATAAYPPANRINSSWFKLGFPSGYVTDVLQILEVMADLGLAGDPRLAHALDLVRSKQDDQGRWRNEYSYADKTWTRWDEPRTPSKWVTLRACRVLKAAAGA